MSDATLPGAFQRIPVGDVEVIVLSDGTIDLPLSLFPDADGTDPAIGPGPFATAINCFAIRADGRTLLVDAGCGPWRGSGTGRLLGAMGRAGLDPAAVDVVLMTHLHGDHVGGLRGAAGSSFPKAELMVAEAEAAFWLDEGLPSRAPERMQATIAAAVAGLAAYEGRTTRFRPGQEVAPGIASVPLPGHTPGQTGFRVGSGSEAVFIWADIVHVAAIQFPHPEWPIGFDVDGAQAIRTRRTAFAEAAAEGTRILGSHLAFPGLGRVVRRGSGFGWAPEVG